MNEEKGFVTPLDRIDTYSILRDVMRNLLVILLGALAVGLIVNMRVRSDFQSTYSTKTTFVVTSRTSSNYAYSNLSAASSMANSFSNILNSSRRITGRQKCSINVAVLQSTGCFTKGQKLNINIVIGNTISCQNLTGICLSTAAHCTNSYTLAF